MSYAFHRIDDWAGEVVCRIHLPLIPGPMMRKYVHAVYDGIAKGFVRIIDTNFRADTPALSGWISRCHLLENLQVVLDRAVPPFRRNAVHPLLTHLHLVGVVRVAFSRLEELHAIVMQLSEVVRRMREAVGLDVE